MNKNYEKEILENNSIVGYLRINDTDGTRSIPGQMRLLQSGKIELTLTLEPFSAESIAIHGGWLYTENGETLESRAMPSVCQFHCSGGFLTLIDLRLHKWKSHQITAPVEAIYYPRYVISGLVEDDYWRRPLAMRAEIGGLKQWMHAPRVSRSMFLNRESIDNSLLEKVTLETRDFQSNIVDVKLNKARFELGIEPIRAVQYNSARDEIIIQFRSAVSVFGKEPMPWKELLDKLRFVQELICVLSWRKFEHANLYGRFGQNIENLPAYWEHIGTEPPPPSSPVGGWLRIFSNGFRASNEINILEDVDFIAPYSFNDDSPLLAWFSLRERFRHPIALFLQIIGQAQLSPGVVSLQLGAGIESLGFKIVEERASKNIADKARAIELFNVVSEPACRLFPDEFRDWSSRANEAYQAMKHLRRSLPSVDELLTVNDLSSLVIQIWFADRLGVDPDHIQQYVSDSSRLVSKYSSVSDPSELAY